METESVMNGFAQKRRSFLLRLSGAGISEVVSQGIVAAEATAQQGGVFGVSEGERLVHFRDHGNIFIKVSPGTGSGNLALGTQQVTRGAGIPIHRHLNMEEAFYVLEGSGNLTLDDVPHSFERGGTIFIPKKAWHGFANPDHELLLLWIVSPAGLEGFFRETCTAPGVPPKQLTREQIHAIALKYGTEFR